MPPLPRRLGFPGPQLRALVNQAKTDPISETCASKKFDCILWVQFSQSTKRGMGFSKRATRVLGHLL